MADIETSAAPPDCSHWIGRHEAQLREASAHEGLLSESSSQVRGGELVGAR